MGNLRINERGEAKSLVTYIEEHLTLNVKTDLFIDIFARESGMNR